jgi:iron complex outermembrane receptor protein
MNLAWSRNAFVRVAMFTGLCALTQAQESGQDLSLLRLEDLMNIQVTSVSKKQQTISQAAAAISVITQEDIQRSGATNIPDLLRMVPGLDVAQINANTWAISARGFNSQFANKLLVLIDGRAVYTPLLGGVSWETLDVPVEDIDRIEVILGPGGTIWGANAVNGVINVITKKTADTLGGVLTTGGGTQNQEFGTARFGAKIGDKTTFRLFTKYLNDSHFPDPSGLDGRDGWHLLHGGFRADTRLSAQDAVTVEGDLYAGSEGATIVHSDLSISDNVNVQRLAGLSGGNLLGRWVHTFSGRSDMAAQVYFDRETRSGPESLTVNNTIDFDFQHHLALGDRHDLIWGVGFRTSPDHTVGTIDQSWLPADRRFDLFSAFVQDEIALRPKRVFLTVGTKLEQNNFTGFDFQPSVRVAWTPDARHTLWAAISSADRIPARRDLNLSAVLAAMPGPAEVVLYGNPNMKNEHVIAYEAGHRMQPYGWLSTDVSVFFNTYSRLESINLLPPYFAPGSNPPILVHEAHIGNEVEGHTGGFAMSANWKATRRWTLSPGYSFLALRLQTDPDRAADAQGSNPTHQAQLRSRIQLLRGLTWDTNAYFVGRLPDQFLPSYTRLDTQLTWSLGENLKLALVGQNLLRDRHQEFNGSLQVVNSTQVKRGAYAQLRWRF